LPNYMMLSRTWEDEEVAFQDMTQVDRRTTSKRGYSKITQACRLVFEKNVEYIWVDTCCIDKSSSAELTEGIYYVFQWCQKATKTFSYKRRFPGCR
ncbi:hypothetical protein B0T21DRAFT_278719, partial [Apiosordaria backusii]